MIDVQLSRLIQLAQAGSEDAIRAARAYERMRRLRRGSKAFRFEQRTVERLARRAAEAWIRGEQ